MSKWISVEERLPDIHIPRNDEVVKEWDMSEPVLVYCEEPASFSKCHMFTAYYNKITVDTVKYEWYEALYDEIVHPVAWMPLPLPPEALS